MKKRWPLIVAAALVLGGIVAYTSFDTKETYANINIVSGDAAFRTFSSIDELEEYSELVVLVEFTGDREYYQRNDEKGRPMVKLSKSTVEVKKVLKGDVQKKDTITVFEDAYIADDRYITTEGYKWMNEDGKYILFLRSQPVNDTYVINGIYQGKYDVNIKTKAKEYENKKDAFLDPQSEYMGHDFELEEFNKLKDQALKKYGL